MKKISFLIMLGCLAVIVLSGCQKDSQDGTADTNQSAEASFTRPEERADISGLVKSVVGNEVTILKMDRPERTNDEAGNAANGQIEDQAPVASLGGATTAGPGAGGGRPGVDAPRDGQGGGEGFDSEKMLEMIRQNSTGEEKVIVPVGIQMLKGGSGNAGEGAGEQEANLSDIKANSMIMIWLDSTVTDRQVAKFVVVGNSFN